MDSTCGLLINLGTAIGEPLSTWSKLNKAHPEMALFFLNSPSAPLSCCRGLEQIKWENLDCEILMDIYHTYCKGYIHYGGEISFPIMKKSTQGLWGKYKKSMFDLSTSEFFRVGRLTEEKCMCFLWQFLFTSPLYPILQYLTLKASLGCHTHCQGTRILNFLLETERVTEGGWVTVEPNHGRYLKAS